MRGASRRDRLALGARRLARDRLLAGHGEDGAGLSRRVVRVRRSDPDRRRRNRDPLRARRRDAQGLGQVARAPGGRRLPPPARRCGGRRCGRRRGCERPREARGLCRSARATRRAGRRAQGLRARAARALQAPARCVLHGRAAPHPPRQGGPRPAAAAGIGLVKAREDGMESAWICAAKRTPFTRASKGALAAARPDDLLASLFRRLLAALPPGAREAVDEVIVGCAYPEAEQGRNVARAITLASGLADRVAAMTLTRMCASSLEATAIACAKVRLGEASLVLVGGMESMTRIPMGGVKPSPNPEWLERRPEIYMAMGLTAERVAQRYRVARADQDAWALRSHQRAAAARARGVFAAEIEPVTVPARATAPAIAAVPAGALGPEVAADGAPREVRDDDALRPDSTLEKLAALAPAFGADGTVTPGNACPTSDGASALLVAAGAPVA